jgi:hypothetical protein
VLINHVTYKPSKIVIGYGSDILAAQLVTYTNLSYLQNILYTLSDETKIV